MSVEHGPSKMWVRAPVPARAMRLDHGFTMVEVLVVLAILVMLFGLLFTPLMTGMEMFTQAEQTVSRQDTSSLAYKQIAQELAGAYFILDRQTMFTERPTPFETATGQYDFSRIAFVPSVVGTSRVPQPSIVQYWVALADPGRPFNDGSAPGPLNTYVLYRGQWSGADLASAWTKWANDEPPDILTSLTPKEQGDIPGNTIFADGSVAEGYWERNPATGSPALGHQIRGVQFAAQQVVGEQLELDSLGMQYVAKHGYWEGPQYNGADYIAPQPLSGSVSGPMAPRIIVYRWDSVTGAYQPIADTEPDPSLRVAPLPNPATCFITYDSYRGRVIAAQFRWAEYPDSDANASNNLIPKSAYEYDLPGLAAGNLKVVPGSVKVYYGWPLANPTSWTTFVRSDGTAWEMQTGEYNLAEAVEQTPWAVNTTHITFSATSPPNTAAGRIVVKYQVRNNFYVNPANPNDPYNGLDDIVRINYFTRELMGAVVTVAANAAVEKVDPEATPEVKVNEALMARQAGIVHVVNMPLSPSARSQ